MKRHLFCRREKRLIIFTFFSNFLCNIFKTFSWPPLIFYNTTNHLKILLGFSLKLLKITLINFQRRNNNFYVFLTTFQNSPQIFPKLRTKILVELGKSFPLFFFLFSQIIHNFIKILKLLLCISPKISIFVFKNCSNIPTFNSKLLFQNFLQIRSKKFCNIWSIFCQNIGKIWSKCSVFQTKR